MKIIGNILTGLLFNQLIASALEYILICALAIAAVGATASIYGPKIAAYWNLLNAGL